MKLKNFFSLFLGTAMALPAVLATDPDVITATESLKALFNAIAQLFKGNIDQFVIGLKDGIIVIAVFIIVWQLFSYIGKITIFRGEEGKKHANWLGIGLGLIAVAYPTTFVVVSRVFGKTGIIIFFFLALFFMIYQFVAQKRTHSSKDRTGQLRAKKDELIAERDVNKERHDNKLEKTFDKKEYSDLKSADEILRKDISGEQNARAMINSMREALSKIGAVDPRSRTAVEIKEQLLSKMAPFAGIIKKEETDLRALSKRIHEAETFNFRDLQLDKNETELYTAMATKFKDELNTKKHFLDENESVDQRLQKHEQALKNIISQAKNIDVERQSLLKEAEQLDLSAVEDDAQADRLVRQLTSALSMGDFGKATVELNTISSYIDRLDPIERKLYSLIKRLEELSLKKSNIENEMALLEKKIMKDERGSAQKLRSTAGKFGSFVNKHTR